MEPYQLNTNIKKLKQFRIYLCALPLAGCTRETNTQPLHQCFSNFFRSCTTHSCFTTLRTTWLLNNFNSSNIPLFINIALLNNRQHNLIQCMQPFLLHKLVYLGYNLTYNTTKIMFRLS